MPVKIWLAVGISTLARAPLVSSTRPAFCSEISASRMAGRPTPKRDLQVALWRQLLSRLQFPGQDLRLEMRRDMLEELLAFYDEWVDHRPFIPSCLTTMQQLAMLKLQD